MPLIYYKGPTNFYGNFPISKYPVAIGLCYSSDCTTITANRYWCQAIHVRVNLCYEGENLAEIGCPCPDIVIVH